VCKRSKDIIESKKNPLGQEEFRYHVDNTHSIWKYLNYRLYLDKKEKNDYTGIEDTIHNKISESKLDWIPSSEADEVETAPAYAEEQTELLETLKNMMDELTKKVEAIKIPAPEAKAPEAPAPAA
jgi:hypothetical protein